MRTALLATLALAALLGLSAAPASAGTVEVVIERVPQPDFEGFLTRQVRYDAGPGERNRVTVRTVGEAVRIIDPGRRLRARSPDCRSVATDAVECTWDGRMPPGVGAGLITANVRTHDGDDTVRVDEAAPAQLIADGGSGDDVLRGSDTIGDQLDGGGGGHDRLYGGDNSDTLTDGDTSGAADDDVLDGGRGGAALVYQGRTRGVTVNLLRGRGGEAGEHDRLTGFHVVYSGSGNDRLIGDGGFNSLDGGPGRDHLDGEGGGDFLNGGLGNDRLHGHAGDDFLDGGPGADQLRGDAGDDHLNEPQLEDVLACGDDEDFLGRPAQRMLIPGSCERLGFDLDPRNAFPPGEGTSLRLEAHPASVAQGVATFSIGCPVEQEDEDGCTSGATATLLLRDSRGGEVLGTTRLRWTADGEGGSTTSGDRVRLTAAGRRAAARPQGVATDVVLRFDSLGTVRWAIRLGGHGA